MTVICLKVLTYMYLLLLFTKPVNLPICSHATMKTWDYPGDKADIIATLNCRFARISVSHPSLKLDHRREYVKAVIETCVITYPIIILSLDFIQSLWEYKF